MAPRRRAARAIRTIWSGSSSACRPTIPERLYLRVFDPEPAGAHDTRYGRSKEPTRTLYRLSGGPGAYAGAPLPAEVEDGAGPAAADPAYAGFAGGRVLAERRFDEASPTDGTWVTLAPFSARDGDVVDGRAYFRLDVIGEAGDYGNAFTVEASLSPDRSDQPPEARLFAYEPTIRWRDREPPTEVRFDAPAGAALRLQSFDGAEGELALVSTFDERRLQASGQDEWRVDAVRRAGAARRRSRCAAALESPNDVTLALFDADGKPVAAGDAAACRRRRRRGRWRWPRRGRSPTAPRSPSTPRPRPATAPLAFRWRFGDGAESDAPVIAHPFATPGQYEARARRCSAAATSIARGAPGHRAGARAAGAGGAWRATR